MGRRIVRFSSVRPRLVVAIATATVLPVLVWSPTPAAAAGATITVTSTSASEVDGQCGLYEAIVNANQNAATYPECPAGVDDDVIEFAIPGTGPFVIDVAPTAGLPPIEGTLTIDGTTQPGFVGFPLVEVDNQSVPGFPVLDLTGSTNSVVRGLVLNNAGPSQPIIDAGDGSVIRGNWIGLHADGTGANEAPALAGVRITAATGVQVGAVGDGNVISNNEIGVWVDDDASNTTIRDNRIGTNPGGTSAVRNTVGIQADVSDTGSDGLAIIDNLISGNTGSVPTDGRGISVTGWSTGVVIQGNHIGVNVDGNLPLPNGVGVQLGGDAGNVDGTTIGGTGPGQGNVISGNLAEAIILAEASTDTEVIGNRIGLAVTGDGNLDNNRSLTAPGDSIIRIENSSSNRIGGISENEANVVGSLSGATMVYIESGVDNEVVGNSLVGYGEFLVDLAPVGYDGSDEGDLDTGPNNLQNWPEVSASVVEGDLRIDYIIDSDESASAYPLQLDIYIITPGGDGPSAVDYLGSRPVAFPGGGYVTFGEVTIEDLYDRTIFGIVRDAAGNTSEPGTYTALTGPDTFVVNSTGDEPLEVEGEGGGCSIDSFSGTCTLRSAIEAANMTPVEDTIVFDIPGTDPIVISPESELPTITAPLTIDGLSAPDTSCATWPPTLRVTIDVSNAFNGITLDGDQITLRGLVINGEPTGNLVYLESGTSDAVFECNFFGTDTTGTEVVGASQASIWFNGADNNRIGGVSDSQRNLFAGVATNYLWMADADNNVVDNNHFGVDAPGTSALGISTGAAIAISGDNNVIGGSAGGPAGNLIAHRTSTVAAIQVASGGAPYPTGNTIRQNRLYDNAGIGIDLYDASQPTTEGVTLNHEGVIAGPNAFQNFPVLTLATTDGIGTRVAGYIQRAPVEDGPTVDYRIDVYSNSSCDPTFFGEGEMYLGSIDVTDFGSGSAFFDETGLGIGFGEPAGVTATATDLDTGNTSEFSYCRPVTTTNLNWYQAQPVADGSTTQQYITDNLQEKWFVVGSSPGADVNVTVTGQPGTAVSIHTDPLIAYNAAANPTSAVALAAEAADVGFLPSGSLPSGSLPSGSLPSGSLPSGSLPSGSLPTGYLPSGSLPSGSLPSGSLPSGSLPSGSLPSGSLPSGSLPSGSLPSGSLPSGSLPSGSLPSGSLPSGSLPSGSLPSGSLPSGSLDAYSTASRRSLIAYSANPWTTTQTISRNTFDYAGPVYIRVVGPYDLENPFSVTVDVEGGVCEVVTPVVGDAFPVPAETGRSTVILTDTGRLQGSAEQVAQAVADLETFAARPEVNGVVVDLASVGRVVAANAQADAVPNCAFAKNIVAEEIKAVVDAYRPANPLEYVVIAGGSDVIPFHQVSDVGGLANEREYIAPARPNSPTEAGLRSGLVKGQDFYGSSASLNLGGRTIVIPDLAVGRLVDTADDVSTAVAAYVATDGSVAPSSALVTGYDFVGDAAATVDTVFSENGGTANTTLIQAPGLAPTDDSAWSADELRTPLLSGDHDLFMLTGHFSAGKLLAADYRTTLPASEITGEAAAFTDAVVLALGCHAGFSLPGVDQIDASPDPDWAEAFLSSGAAAFVAATGYAYGDTELEEYGERLFIELARQLRTGAVGGEVAMGKALVAAKQAYLAQVSPLTGLDEKTLQEMTLYGFPMMGIVMPGDRTNAGTPDSVVPPGSTGTVDAVSTGLTSTNLSLPSTPSGTIEVSTPITVTLDDLVNGGTVDTQYQRGRDGVVARPNEPVLAKQIDRVDVPGEVLRGVALRGGTYTDTTGVIPFTSAPTTETSRSIQSFQNDTFSPTQVGSPNFTSAVNGGPTWLVTVPQQFVSSPLGSVQGTVRTWQTVDYSLYYLPDTWNQVDSPSIEAGVASAPVISGVTADVVGDEIVFSVNAFADSSTGVAQVWVLFTGVSGSTDHGVWVPVDLAREADTSAFEQSTFWSGALPIIEGRDPESIRFMVQAVGAGGLTTLNTNNGAYFQVGVPTRPTADADDTVTTLDGPSTGRHGDPQTFTATVRAGAQPVANAVVEFEIAGQRTLAVTDGTGVATATVTPFALPGDYEVRAALRGSAVIRPSEDSAPFTVTSVPASVELSLDEGVVVASLTSDDGGLGGKPVVFALDDGTTTNTIVVITDAWGDARLVDPDVPAGSYVVTATFGTGLGVDLDDPVFDAATSNSITLALGDQVPPTITASATAGGNPYVAGAWVNGDVVVSFECDDIGSGIASCPAPITVTTSTTSVEGEAVDNAGLRASTSFGPVRIDRIAPSVTITSPANGATFTVGQAASAAYSCADDDSGVASCTGTVADGAALDTATAGTKSFVVTGTDVAGNSFARSVSYTVTAPAANLAPTVTIDMGINGLQEIGFRDGIILLTGRYSDPDGRGPYQASVRWQSGGPFTPLAVAYDGSVAALGFSLTSGPRTVTVRVCDRQGACGTDDIVVRPWVTARVVPVLQCVADRKPSTPRYRARFGYDNPASYAIVTVPLLDNVVRPGPVDRGQPAIFLPGSQRNVFTADFSSGSLTWTLHGRTVTAKANSPRC